MTGELSCFYLAQFSLSAAGAVRFALATPDALIRFAIAASKRIAAVTALIGFEGHLKAIVERWCQ